MNTHVLRLLDRTVRTALQVLVGYLAVSSTLGNVDWRTAGAAAALAAVVAFVHGLADLPPLPGSWGGDVAGRAIRTFLQTVTAGVGTAVLITDVSWGPLLSAAAVAALTSLVTSLAATPLGPRSVKGTPEVVGPPTL